MGRLPYLLGFTAVAVAAAAGVAAAEDLRLRVFPNPFLAGIETVQVGYVLPETARVTLKVYDAAGALVRTLRENVDRSEGAHEREDGWDGRDQDGELVAPGPYVVALEAQGHDETRRESFVCIVKR